jgi:hypothetical protein
MRSAVGLGAAADGQRPAGAAGAEQGEPVVLVLEGEEGLAVALRRQQLLELARRERVRGERVAVGSEYAAAQASSPALVS